MHYVTEHLAKVHECRNKRYPHITSFFILPFIIMTIKYIAWNPSNWNSVWAVEFPPSLWNKTFPAGLYLVPQKSFFDGDKILSQWL